MTEETPHPLPATTGPSRYAQRLLAHVRAFDTHHPWVWDATVTLTWTVAALVDAAGGWRVALRILAKTGTHDRVQAVILAYDTGLVAPGP
ncbi:hypothetical protein [Streptomyces sp. NPDC008122]|uniref:hypothetical protein n=1 Tax=Streptomyces sp. NPDC008122 TaxID=3364810 RepID=UPI0036EE8A59